MVSEKFRHQLRQEAEQWQAEGLIDAEFYAQIAHRYKFAELAGSSSSRFVAILFGFGSILVGLGFITFVAANWQVWSQELRATLLLSAFAGINALGFYLWQRSQPRLGQGLLILGALLLGANLALMSQIFHQSGSVYQLFLVWGLGVLAMAYSLRLTSLGILAIILTGIGYSAGIVTLLIPEEFSGFRLAIEHMPLLVSLFGIPLAYWCRSRWLFGLAVVLIICALEANLPIFLANFYNFSPIARGTMSAIACVLPPALLYAYRDSFPNLLPNNISFAPLARSLGLFFLISLFHLFSFHAIWDFSTYRTGSELVWYDWAELLDVGFLSGLTIWFWWQLGYRNNSSRWRLERRSTAIGAALLITAAVVWVHISIGALGAIATFIFNVLSFLFAIAFIRSGLASGKRAHFWGGILSLALQTLLRMLEYETDLLAKAIVFFLCGMGAICAGLWFERYLRQKG
jgi:uncharacterized membrane protein